MPRATFSHSIIMRGTSGTLPVCKLENDMAGSGLLLSAHVRIIITDFEATVISLYLYEGMTPREISRMIKSHASRNARVTRCRACGPPFKAPGRFSRIPSRPLNAYVGQAE